MNRDTPIPDNLKAMLERSEAEWDAIEDATVTVIGFRAGHTLTEADVAAIQLYERTHDEDDENATEAFGRGIDEGRREAGSKGVVTLLEKCERLVIEKATERALGMLDERRGFERGAQACREMMARFVEQGGDATTANSIRANWHPGWGADPGAPAEVAASPIRPKTEAA